MVDLLPVLHGLLLFPQARYTSGRNGGKEAIVVVPLALIVGIDGVCELNFLCKLASSFVCSVKIKKFGIAQ